MSKTQKRVGQVTLSIMATVLVLAGLELGFRMVEVDSLDPNAVRGAPKEGEGKCYRPSLTLGYEPRPGTCQFNDAGFEAPGYKMDKPPGTFRVLVLGDSLSAGQAWVRYAETKLRAAAPGKRIELWNGGIPGFDTCSELRMLQERGWAVKPDLVLLQFCVNDFTVTATVVPGEDGAVQYFVGDEGHELPSWLLRSRLLTYLVIRFHLKGAQKIDRIRQNEKYVGRCMGLFAKETAARGVPLTLAIFPALISGEGTPADRRTAGPYRHWEDLAYTLARRHGVDAFPLRLPLESAAGDLRKLRAFPVDPWHPNMKGNMLAGEAIAKHLVQKYFKKK